MRVQAGYGRARSPVLDKLEARVPVGLDCALLLRCLGLTPEGLIHPKVDPAQSDYIHVGRMDTNTRRVRFMGSRSTRPLGWALY